MNYSGAILIFVVAVFLICLFNLEPRIGFGGRLIGLIVAAAILVLVLTSCDPSSDCNLETNYGTTQEETTSCSS